jgi:hypothetical protein
MERQGANGCVDGKERILKLVNWLNSRSERTHRQHGETGANGCVAGKERILK